MRVPLPNLPDVTLRPRRAGDEALLRAVYASTREEELAGTGWDEAQREAFLRFQFQAQDDHYTKHYTTCAFYVVEDREAAIGRLYVDAWPDEVRIVEITLLPRARGRGIGRGLLEAVIAAADVRGLPVTIHVERENPALRLYERLGFERVEERGVHFLMRRETTAALLAPPRATDP